MKKKQLQEMWSASLLNSASCITIDDYANAEKFMAEAINHLNSMRTEYEYYSHPITNFGVLNRLVSENLDELQNNFPEFINEWTATIKSDKNLRAQYLMYEGLNDFDKSFDAPKYITESVRIASEDIDAATLLESNMKAFELLKKHELIIPDTLTEADEKYYGACQYMLEHKKDNLTLSEHSKATQIASEYIKEASEHKAQSALSSLAENVNQLTKDEYAIVEAAMGDEEKQQEVFNNLKDECLKKVNGEIEKAQDDDEDGKARLANIKEALSKKQFNAKTFKEDIVKLVSFAEI
jgi:hypothetical protein